MTEGHIWSIIAMAIMVVCSAYFSATETAFNSVNKTRLRALAEKGNKLGKDPRPVGELRHPAVHHSDR